MKTSDPMQRDVFDSGARARSSDPETSKAAAQSVQNMRASHKRVLAMFQAYGDMTDETLAEYLNEAAQNTGMKPMSPSGVRSRRSELSKPNMDRLDEIAAEMTHCPSAPEPGTPLTYYQHEPKYRVGLRARLLTEGVRSPLWDTGKREKLASGREAIVWGLAK